MHAQELDPTWDRCQPSFMTKVTRKFSKHFCEAEKPQNTNGTCLNNILYQWKTNNLNVNIPCIISNHKEMQEIVEHYGITYNYMPINKNNKIKQEKELLLLIKKYKVITML